MVFKVGSRGEEVRLIQEALNRLHLNPGPPDGIYGEKTRAAVIAFQRQHKLNADGIVGRITWAALLPRQELPEAGVTFPLLQRDLLRVLGNPLEAWWAGQNLKFIDLTEFKHLLWKVVGFVAKNGFGFWGHRLIEKPIKNVFHGLMETGLLEEIETFDGCFCVRKMKGGRSLSVHSWALAVDLNAAKNPFNGGCAWSDEFLQVWARHGWENGWLWDSPTDAMHFQFAWTRDWREYEGDFVPVLPAIDK